MTLGTKPLTSKPGAFYARCHLPRIVKCHLATPAQKDEARRLGLGRRMLGKDSRSKPIWAWAFPAHTEVFETTDRAAYQAHLDEFHDGGQKLAGPWLGIGKKLWTGPRLKADGQPINDRDKVLRRCPTCGLHGEVRGAAGELWWDEHVRGCALAATGAAP